jgi:hypothetical protein
MTVTGRMLESKLVHNPFDARRKIADWHREYNEERPHTGFELADTGRVYAAMSCGKDAGCARLENAERVSHFPQLRLLLVKL